MICIETIKKRKAVYGNNFPEIARLQSEYFKRVFTPQDVAMSLAILKQVRINFIKKQIEDLVESEFIKSIYKIQELNEALEDSKKDHDNYLWIASNYSKYEQL
jgi:hypothetical protein